MASALVLNAHAAHALAVIRSLGSRGLRVTAGSSDPWNAGRCSRYARDHVEYPVPEDRPEAFLDALERELAVGEYDVLLPVNETTVDLVVANRERFEDDAALPFPSYEKLFVGLNKRQTVEVADELGVPQPKTLFSEEASLDAVEDAIGFPVVVKPERGSGRSGVWVCASRDELERASRRATDAHGPVLFQNFVPNGGERGVYTMYDDESRLSGLTVQHRLRSHPPDGGPSTYRETVDDPELVELADQLLSGLDWRGAAMAEFRVHAGTGEPYLIELNPRLWGSLPLSTYAGVDFPYLLYQLAVGAPLDRTLDYEVGVRARYLFKDALQVMARPDRLRAIREFVTPSEKPCRFDVVSAADPLPALGELAYRTGTVYDRANAQLTDGVRDATPEWLTQ